MLWHEIGSNCLKERSRLTLLGLIASGAQEGYSMNGARTLLRISLLFLTFFGPLIIIEASPDSIISLQNPLSYSTHQTRLPILTQIQQETQLFEKPFNRNHSQITPSIADADRSWTVLIYLDGDNDLEEQAFNEIKEMESVGSTSDVNIIVYVDYFSDQDLHTSEAECYNITKDVSNNETIWSSPLVTPLPTEPNMGDPYTLLEFIKFGQIHSEANNYLLILWDHGAGYKGACVDETNNSDWLLPHELSMVLENDTINPINVVAFDTSYMGQLEIAYEIRNRTELIVFSEEQIPETGFPYHRFLHTLVLYPQMTALEIAQEIVRRYNEAYTPLGDYYDQTSPNTKIGLSVLNTTRVTHVIGWLDTLIDQLLEPSFLELNYEGICASRGATLYFKQPDFIDLGAFAYQLSQILIDPQLQFLSYNITLAVLYTIVFEQHLGGLPGASGLAINFSNHSSVPLILLNDIRYRDFITAFTAIGETQNTSIPVYHPLTYWGYLDGKNDSVYYTFHPQVSTLFTLHLAAMQPYDEDFDLYLYDSNMNLLTRSVELDSTETLQHNFVAGNVYYIRVWSYLREDISHGLGAFTLRIDQGAIVNPISLIVLGGSIVGFIAMIFLIVVFLRRRRILHRSWQGTTTESELA